MKPFDLPTFLVLLAGGLVAMWTVVQAARSASRGRPRLSVSQTSFGVGGLSLTLRNEGAAPAIDVEVRIGGDHDGTVLVRHDALGPGAVVKLTDVCPVGAWFVVDLLYGYAGGVGFAGQRTLRRSGSGPLRIVSSTDQVVRRRLRDWGSDLLQR